jgi:general secretion pathway protein I
VKWRLNVSALPGGNAPLDAWRLDLDVSDGARHAHHSTLQVRSAGSGAGQ